MTAAAEIAPEERAGERLARLRRRYQTTTPRISIERAKYFTESWRQTEGQDAGRRVAMAMQNVFARMTIYVDADERLAGSWTESFVGIPIDIERGVFNEVLAAELSLRTMLGSRLRSGAKALLWAMRHRRLGDLARAGRSSPLQLGMRTMGERTVNAFTIADPDRRLLLGELLPYWRGRTLVDRLEVELAEAGLASADLRDFSRSVPGNTSRQVLMLSTAATIATFQGHLIPDFSEALTLGLDGMLAQVRRDLAAACHAQPAAEFLRALEVGLQAVAIFADRLAAELTHRASCEGDHRRRLRLEQMSAVCARVPRQPASSFVEALQALWTVKTALELAQPMNLHSVGRLDQLLWPYYQRDLAAGVLTRDQAGELLGELLLKIMSHNLRPESDLLGRFYQRYLGSAPVTVGGLTPDGADGTNDLTLLFVEAAHHAKAVTNLAVRVHPDTPEKLLLAVAERLHDGTSSYALYNDTVVIEAMQRRGFTLADARDYAIMGCVEAICPGKTGGMSANALLLNRVLDITLRNGDARTLAGIIRDEGLHTGRAESFTNLDALVDAFLAQAEVQVGKIVTGSNLRDRLFAEALPAPLLSAFIHGCRPRCRDVTAGGAIYDISGISMINSVANLVDSLHAIDTVIFKERRFSASELLAAIDADFVGHEGLWRALQEIPDRWGNGEPATDALARRVTEALFALTHRHRTFRGGPFVNYVISMTTHTIDGRLSIASPDGRRAATPYAASGNPYNVERNGVTAVLRSVAALPGAEMMGCAVNVRFHPTAIGETPAVRAKWAALVRGYFALGGVQLQPTVASAELLRAAQRQPQDHRDLIVKVGGYSTYFVDLGAEIQDEVISRTEHR